MLLLVATQLNCTDIEKAAPSLDQSPLHITLLRLTEVYHKILLNLLSLNTFNAMRHGSDYIYFVAQAFTGFTEAYFKFDNRHLLV